MIQLSSSGGASGLVPVKSSRVDRVWACASVSNLLRPLTEPVEGPFGDQVFFGELQCFHRRPSEVNGTMIGSSPWILIASGSFGLRRESPRIWLRTLWPAFSSALSSEAWAASESWVNSRWSIAAKRR